MLLLDVYTLSNDMDKSSIVSQGHFSCHFINFGLINSGISIILTNHQSIKCFQRGLNVNFTKTEAH